MCCNALDMSTPAVAAAVDDSSAQVDAGRCIAYLDAFLIHQKDRIQFHLHK